MERSPPAWTPAIETAFDQAWRAAVDARRAGALDLAFAHLERAHILGQRRTWPHVRTHVAMLVVGWQRQDRREVLGQVVRTVAALLFSRVWVPVGNTGGANVSPFRPMPLPADLAPLPPSPFMAAEPLANASRVVGGRRFVCAGAPG